MSTKKEGATNAQNEKQEKGIALNAVSAETGKTDFQLVLENQLKELTRKKNLADRRQVFIQKRDSLQSFLNDLDAETLTGNFESVIARISFQVKNGYREDEKFNIANPELIVKHVNYLLSDIDIAIVNIETQLLA